MPKLNLITASLAATLLLAAGDRPVVAQAPSPQAVTRYVVAPHGNEARYRIREQLAGIDFPNDAVGTTTIIQGGIAITEDGTILRDESKITISLVSLKTNNDRRDNFVRRRTLQTDSFPSAAFAPTSLSNLRFPLPAAGDVRFQMIGELTVRGVTRPVTWDVTAKITNGAIRGEARTQFSFADFEIEKPRVRSALSVEDDIRLEYTFFLVPR